MATIDDKVVAMSFESSKFESGVNKTISALDKLKAALHFPGAGKGLSDIDAAAKRVDLGHIARGVEGVKKALETLRLIGIGVLSQLAAQAVRAGGRFLSAFTLDPLKAGFSEYTTNLNAVQTILANTAASGAKLEDVNAALAELNDYSDKTIYNFSQMAKNIGTFTAAGVDLDTATASIKGIANLAALSGSNSEQASTAMYQLSQAISAGRVSLQDWNSVVNAGMGGTVFQRALAQTAEAMGTLKEGTVKLEGPMKNVSIAGESFRQSVSAGPGKESWLTSKVLTATLQQFTGDLSKAELKAQGFNDAQIKAIQATAQTASKAATEVKTLTGVLDTARETAGSGWAQTWQIIFGDFGEAKTLFTGVSNAINGFIKSSADARNKVLGDWKALGGRTVLITSIKNVFEALGAVIAPIKAAFRDIFPATTGQDLYDLTVRFKEFTETLKPSPATIDGLRRTFRGLFAVLDIGKQIIVGIFTMFGKLFGVVGEGSSGFLSITASIGDFLVKVDEALKKGDGINKFFSGLGDILAIPIKLLGQLASALGNLFGGFSSGGFSDQMSGMTGAMTPFQRVLEALATAWSNFVDSVGDSGVLQAAFDGLIKFLADIGPAIGNALSNMNFEAIFAVLRTGLLAGLVYMLKGFFGKGSFLDQISKGLGGGIIANIAGSFKALEGSMVALQNNIKAKTLKEIAIAIGILALSVVALSFVDPSKLKSSLTAIGVMLGELLGAMAILDKIGASAGFIKLPIIAAGLILLAGAIDILAIAVIALSRLSWEELLKGLTGVGALLIGISAASIPLSANSAGMVRAGVGIGAIAVSMKILASAIADFGAMSWTEIGKGLASVAGGLVTLAGAARLMPKGMVVMGAGIIAISVGLKILAGVVERFSGMNWADIGKGLAGVGGALVVIAGAMHLMPTNMALTAAGLLLVSLSLGRIADAVIKMGGMSIEQIAKGLGTLAGALVILAAALMAMSGSIGGAVALGVAAAGIALLAPALTKLGDQSWGEILKGLISLAAALTVLGIAGALLTPVVPSMLGLGAALVLIGGGLALAGAGIFLIGTGLSAIAIAGPAAIGILVAALVELVDGIVDAAKNMVLGLLEIVEALAATAPKFVDALIKIVESLLDVIIRASPKIADAFNALLAAALRVLAENQPKIVQAGFDLIVALLQGLRNNLPQLVSLAVDIVVKFLGSIANNINKIVDAGSDILAALIKGIIQHIANVITTVVSIVARFTDAIADNLGKIAAAGLSIIVKLLEAIAANLGRVIAAGADVIVSFVTGIGDAAGKVVTAAVDTMIKFMNTLSRESVKLADAGAIAIINFLNGIARAIDAHEGEMIAAGFRVGTAIVTGMIRGLGSQVSALYGKISGIMNHAMSLIHKIPLIKSPSQVTTDVGENIILGLVKGLDENAEKVYDSAEAVSYGLIDRFRDIFQIKSPSKVMHDIGQLVGQGFAQGLKGSQDDIRKAFEELNNKLTDAMVTARETIKSEQDKINELRQDAAEQQAKLDKLRAEKKPDVDAIKNALADLRDTEASIKEIQAVIKVNEDLLERTTDGHNALIQTLKDEKRELVILAGDYDRISEKLKDAQKALEDIRKARADAISSTTAQYAALPTLDETTPEQITAARKNITDAKKELTEALAEKERDQDKITQAQLGVGTAQEELKKLLAGKALDSAGNSVDQLATYEDALKHQTTAIGAYNSTLQQLRKLGLDDATYQKLVDDGVADAAFAKQLLAGGRTAVTKLNKLDADLQFVSNRLGKNVGREMFDAGVKAAQGIVNGLENKKDDVTDKMTEIGNEMVRAMKKSLGIKSPSTIFAELGMWSMAGMARGFTDSAHLVIDAADQVVKDSLTAVQRSMQNVAGAVFNEMDLNPVITPILDLTTVQAQSKVLANMIPITAAASYGQASIISASQNLTQTDIAEVAAAGTSVKFEQNNYSPEALTEIEIYRQTKNQLSQLKSALALT